MTAAMKLLCMLCGCARRLIRFGMTVNYGLIVVLEGDPLVAIKALIKPESPLSSIGPWIEV